MFLRSSLLVLAGLLATAGVLASGGSHDEQAARQLLHQMNELFNAKASSYRKFADDSLSPQTLMREELRPFYPQMEQYAWQNFTDPQLRRQFEVILRGSKYPPINLKFKMTLQTLRDIGRNKWTCSRQDAKSCGLAFVPQIKTIVTNSDDLEEIQYYWAEWRNKMPASKRQALDSYVQYWRNLGLAAGLKPSAIWYDSYESPDFIEELTALMDAILPFYKNLHAHLRHVLRAKYGDNIVDASGLIPHHLMEQVLYQSWKKNSVLQNPFSDRKLPNLQIQLEGHQFTAFDLVNVSVEYFGTMGFRNISDDFMREHFIPIEAGRGGADCKSKIFDFGEIEMDYCPKVSYKKLLQTHGDVSRIEYAIHKNDLPVGLNEEACPGFGNALGEAVILAASTPKHLQGHLGLLKNYEYDDILNLNRLYRLAVHTLLTLPSYYVHERLWVEMIDGLVEPKDYNCRYWTLMQQYMGVKAPVKTVAEAYDMPYKFYEGIIDQYRSTKKVFGEFLGYQIYRAICLKIGEFERGNAYKELNNCDFSHNRQAGKFLQDMMDIGSSQSWREIIKPLTIRNLTSISGTAFLEYFESLNQFLADDNVTKNLSTGWQPIAYCPAY